MRSLDYYHSWYQTAPDIHKSIGILLILLIVVRVILRGVFPAPKPLLTHQKWEITLSHLVHILMYLLIFGILISGYLIGTADNRGIDVFSFFEVPALFTAFEEQEDIAGFIHEWSAYVLMALVALHIAGAVKHHVMDKDDTLKRML